MKGLAVALATFGLLGVPLPAAHAHDQPEGAAWLMADWMLLSFLVFFFAALIAFVVAARRGQFRNLEAAKYYILTIDEPDYYTPEWAKEPPRRSQESDPRTGADPEEDER